MSISIASIDALPDYSDANLVKLYKWALANNAAGQTITINGRSRTLPSIKEMRETIDWAENRSGSDQDGGLALVQFGERQ